MLLAANGAMIENIASQKGEPVSLPPEPELRLARCGDDADPRLVELVRLLARRAAQRWYEHLAEEHARRRS